VNIFFFGEGSLGPTHPKENALRISRQPHSCGVWSSGFGGVFEQSPRNIARQGAVGVLLKDPGAHGVLRVSRFDRADGVSN